MHHFTQYLTPSLFFLILQYIAAYHTAQKAVNFVHFVIFSLNCKLSLQDVHVPSTVYQ